MHLERKEIKFWKNGNSLTTRLPTELVKTLGLNKIKKGHIYPEGKNKIVIEDIIKSNVPNLKLKKLTVEPSISIMHVPSSNFFHFADISSDENFNPTNLAQIFNEKGLLGIQRIIEFSQGKADIKLVIAS